MVTINFTSAGGTQDVSYSMSCNKKPTFDVPDEYKSWLKINSVSSTEPKITISAHTYESTSSAERTGYIVAKIGNDTCGGEKRLMVVQDGGGEQTTEILWNENTNLNPVGNVRSLVGTFSSNDPLFDINELVVNTPDWITPEVEETSTGEGNIYFTYGYTPISRLATAGVTYRRAASHNGQKDFPQEGDPYQTGLAFAITKAELNVCGGIEDKIGEYYYTDNFTYVQNTSFTCTTKPDWVSSVTFGIPDPSTKTGEIYATYSRNTETTERIWEGITITYSGYQDVMPNGTTTITQHVVDASVGACGDAANPGTPPQSCSEANFYHLDNPYVPGDLSYYYLEHDVTAYEQDYEIRTNADFCEYIVRSNGTRLPISTIEDPMWRDVRVEIYDVVPNIIHNSACGSHPIEVKASKTLEYLKEKHENGNCPCHTPHSGEYVIEGYNSSELVAVFENGKLVESADTYNDFWFKAVEAYDDELRTWAYGLNSIKDCYNGGCKYRSVKFSIERNTFEGAFDRCAMVKIYPKINGVYCTEDCQDCERTAKCQNERNCCLTDMIVQESVDCTSYKTYFKIGIDGHAYSPRYMQAKPGEGVNNRALYEYCWGPCDDKNEDETAGYVDAVDIYEAIITRSYDSGNIKHTTKIGDYLGTVYASGNDYSTYGRTQWTSEIEARAKGGTCITDVSFESKLENGQHRGYVYFSADGYTNESSDPNDVNRYRGRILVPYHKGENYYSKKGSWKFVKGDEYDSWYGPVDVGYNVLNGHGIFCVLEQDGQGNV